MARRRQRATAGLKHARPLAVWPYPSGCVPALKDTAPGLHKPARVWPANDDPCHPSSILSWTHTETAISQARANHAHGMRHAARARCSRPSALAMAHLNHLAQRRVGAVPAGVQEMLKVLRWRWHKGKEAGSGTGTQACRHGGRAVHSRDTARMRPGHGWRGYQAGARADWHAAGLTAGRAFGPTYCCGPVQTAHW